ncbi:hypothetical protein F5Y18DRAFT_138516 [Xylariaceae sp. FL1019]|nr:hypothetical protein F5Y18DRAFT_138516 [Xylariaceae sp. FL1019]
MAETPPSSSFTDDTVYLYTSLTAGSSHIVTATSRLHTILLAKKVPFTAIDLATDPKARMLWSRRAEIKGVRMRKLPGLVRNGAVIGDLVEIEEWNEYGELLDRIYDKKPAPVPTDNDKAKIPLPAPSTTTSAAGTSTAPRAANTSAAPIKSIAEEAALKAKKVQLERLREKVHGKKEKDAPASLGGKDKENTQLDGAVPAMPQKDKSSSVDVTEGISGLSISGAAALQSPTTGQAAIGSAQPTLQSPTSGTWKSTTSMSGVSDHRGSVLADAPPEDVTKVDKKSSITEVSSSEDDDSEDEDEQEEDDDDDEGDEGSEVEQQKAKDTSNAKK